MKAPLVSICIPSYNYGRFIANAVDSALAQTHPNIEVVVSDNGSDDETFDVLERYADDPRVRVFRNASNIGITPNFNAAIKRSRGEYIVSLSADDALFPEHVATLLARMLDPCDPVDVVYSGALLCDAAFRPQSFRGLFGQIPLAYSGRDELGELLYSCFVCMPTMLLRRSDFDEVGFLDERFRVASDWEHAVRLSRAGKRFAYLPTAYTAVRLHGAQASGVEQYFSKADDMREWLMFLEETLIDEYAWRFHGHELAIKRQLRGRLGQLDAQDATLVEYPVRSKINEMIERLDAYAAALPQRPPGVPRISVVIATNGRAVFLQEALASLAAQTYTDWEAVIVQCSGSSLGPWVRSLQYSEKIRFVYRETNGSPGELRNIGMRISRGELICFLDDDNCYAPDHLATAVATLDAQEADGVVCGAALVVDALEGTVGFSRVERYRREDAFDVTASAEKLTVVNAIALNALLLRRTVFDRVGGLREDIVLLEDWEFVLRVIHAFKLAPSRRSTVEIHVHLHLSHQALGSFATELYLRHMDILYGFYPSALKEIEMLRTLHRDLVAQMIAELRERSGEAEALVETIAAISGSYLPSTFGTRNDSQLVTATI